MEPDSYEALRRKEKWYGRLMVIFFVVGIILYSFSFVFMMTTVSAFFAKGPSEMTPERLIEFEQTMKILRIAGALGGLLTTMAFILLVYWAYLKGKREGMEKPKEKRKKKRTWKVLQPRKHD